MFGGRYTDAAAAISTVLNNPHKRQAPPKAHSHLPTVPPADLPRVRRKDFDVYLRSIGPEWERFQASSQLGREGIAQLDSMQHEETTPNLSTSSSASSLSLSEPTTPITPRTPRSVIQLNRELPPLESVPSVFFKPEFDLGEAHTFEVVTELKPDSDTDPAALAHSLPLLERLSHHADTVEQHLVREIAARSSSFFAALTNLQELQTESAQCLSRIAHLRARLQEVDDGSTKRGLEIVRHEWKVENVHRAQAGLRVVGGAVEMTGVARNLVNSGQWGEALNVVENMEKLWETTPELPPLESFGPPPPFRIETSLSSVPESPSGSPIPPAQSVPQPPAPTIPLSSLSAFSALPTHLRALTLEIATSLSTELVTSLRADLRTRIDTDLTIPEAQAEISKGLRNRLRPLLDGLVRTRAVKEAVVGWRDVAMEQVKDAMQRVSSYDITVLRSLT
jgi:vacuolar protein sorting-associated protein 54